LFFAVLILVTELILSMCGMVRRSVRGLHRWGALFVMDRVHVLGRLNDKGWCPLAVSGALFGNVSCKYRFSVTDCAAMPLFKP